MMAWSDPRAIAGILLKLYGRTFTEDLGIDAKVNEPSPFVLSSDQRIAVQHAHPSQHCVEVRPYPFRVRLDNAEEHGCKLLGATR